ncbi:MAG: nitroreductase family protein [bacterium]
MAKLDLTPDELLTTTRSVRRRLDTSRPVEMSVIRECLEIALQAPTGGNAQGWHFVVVTDAAKRAALAELFRKAVDWYREQPTGAGNLFQDDPVRGPQQRRVMDSVEHLVENLHAVPVHLIPCLTGRPAEAGPMPAFTRGGSIYPAVWSFMLAARQRGLGSVLTTLHLLYEREAAELLGIPFDTISQAGLVPVAHYTGETFRPARRQPLDSVLHLDGWA